MFRKMRLFNKQADNEECISILKSAPRGVLALLGDEGYPYTVPMDFVYDDGSIYFHSALSGHKVDAIKNYDKASFCVLSDGVRNEGEWWYNFTSVIAFGRIKIVEDEKKAIEKLKLLGLKYFPEDIDVDEDVNNNHHKIFCVELKIEHLTGKHIAEK
ncbi:MAG: pyridoxamine 5'-phosphate oxidase family protein [Lachnospiraceae bacterium]|nr:pyridoxamine 5'-phosphate oxidase family protein [Lachnospiraceae bacterium]